ncbi:hypothetical protein GJAV_G00187330 [Gymnothorax javanicus]|nr:hypothetical protein GJAV_G00187330 [Gymnothorax javanicus]
MRGSSELWLSWNISARASASCLGSEVSYRKDSGPEEKMTGELSGRSFTLPFPSERSRYTFKVRVRVTESCLQSAWSDWSSPRQWGPKKLNNITSTDPVGGNSMGWLPYTLALVCCAAVVTGFIFVFQNERLRVILIPVVPKPGKTLDELLNTYNGNVEDWLNISPDFAEGFKPSFSEPACPVREYSLIPQRTSSGSADSVPDLQDESDSLYKSCSTNSSSISASPEHTPAGLV